MSSDSMNHRYVIGLLVGFLSLSLLGGLGVGAAQAQYVDTTRITSEGTSGFKGDGEFGAAVAPFSAHPEVIIGAPRENVGSDEGVTHLVSPTTGQIVETLNTANPTNLGRFGASVGSVADTVVVGAPNEDPPSGETGAGYAYLFDGTSGARLKTLQTSSAEREPGRGLGRAVAGIGDVNGDGEPDAVVGAPGKTVGGNSGAGKAYIFSGADGSVLGVVTGAGENTGRFGEAVAAVGDVIGDATPDFLVGAPREDVSGTGDAGRVYLFSGGDRSNVVELTAPSGNRVAGGRFGIALSTVGGESDPDFLVGAYREDGGGIDQAGRAYLLDGANPQSSPLQAFTSALPEQSGEFGRSVSGLSDVNGDGTPDGLIGAPNEDTDADGNATDNQGRAYVVDGADGSVIDVLESPNSVPGGQFGDAVAGIASIGTNGLPEVVTGALGETVNGLARAGRAYTFSIPEIAFVDGRDGEPYDPADASAGDTDVPVGRYKLSTNDSRSMLESVTVSNEGTSVSGVSAIELWSSADNSFDAGNDTKLLEKSYSANTTFSAFSASVATDDTYLFLVLDLGSSPSGTYDPAIASEADIGFNNGHLATVNGTPATTFSVADGEGYLSTGSTSPLPVELTRLEATASLGGVALEWRTASEQNNAGFRVQRRVVDVRAPGARRVADVADGDWTRVGRVDGSGTTSSPQTYRFTDEGLPAGADTLQYRLAQVDLDGSVNLSDPVTVGRGAPSGVKLLDTYPNPARTRATVALAVPEQASGDATLRLYDVLGRQVRTVDGAVEPGRSTATVDVSGLPSGVYVLRLSADGTTRTRRLTVVK